MCLYPVWQKKHTRKLQVSQDGCVPLKLTGTAILLQEFLSDITAVLGKEFMMLFLIPQKYECFLHMILEYTVDVVLVHTLSISPFPFVMHYA